MKIKMGKNEYLIWTQFQGSFEEIIKEDMLKFINLNPTCWVPDILSSYRWIDDVFLFSIIEQIEKKKRIKIKRGCYDSKYKIL